MTDTPMTQDKHDTLIERLEAIYTQAPSTMYINRDIIQEAISRLKQSQWVKIDDPRVEEWKDFRPVLLFKSGEIYSVRWITESEYGPVWATPDGHVIFGATKACLPPVDRNPPAPST